MADLYSNAMREASQRDMLQLVQRNTWLQERNAQLEQLVNEAIPILDRYTYPGTTDADAWLKRAVECLGQEKNG